MPKQIGYCTAILEETNRKPIEFVEISTRSRARTSTSPPNPPRPEISAVGIQEECRTRRRSRLRIDRPSLRQPGVAMLGALLVLSAGVYAFNVETPSDISMLPSGDFIDLISRDAEAIPQPISFGHKYMTGGAGEGEQKLREEDNFQPRQQVKSDSVLPAYCEPPNPCPVGFGTSDGCLEEFENTAEFSRNYQAQQHCICDQEHMFNCAEKEANDVTASLQDLLDEHGLHRNMIAKKYHEKRSSDEHAPRRKRSIPERKPNPYLQGEPLRTVQKKDGRRTW